MGFAFKMQLHLPPIPPFPPGLDSSHHPGPPELPTGPSFCS